MRFNEFRERFKEFIIFNLTEIRKIDNDFDQRRLSEWLDKKYIKNIKREYYIFSDLEINEKILFIIANTIYQPSYISFEMALSNYNLIPESVYGITSASTLKTNSFKTEIGHFSYKHIKPELMFGYELGEYNNHRFKIAEIEKAILDYLYLNPQVRKYEDFEGLRFNANEFNAKADIDKLLIYLEIYKNKTLSRRVKNFLAYIENA